VPVVTRKRRVALWLGGKLRRLAMWLDWKTVEPYDHAKFPPLELSDAEWDDFFDPPIIR
jgi:hypothetical protein